MEVAAIVADAAREGARLQILAGQPLLQCFSGVHIQRLYMLQLNRSSGGCRFASGRVALCTTKWDMAEESLYKPTFIRAWRKFRGKSIDQLAADAGMDKGNLSKLERGLHPYKQDTLDPIAKALGTTSEILITRGPEDPARLYEFIARANPTVRRQIEEAAAAIYKAAGSEDE